MALTLGTPISNDDVSPEGQRFLIRTRIEQAGEAPTPINAVLNWTEGAETERAARVQEMTVAGGTRLVTADEEGR